MFLDLLSAANEWVDMSHKPYAITPVLSTGVLISRPEQAPHRCLWVSAHRSAGKICSNGHTVRCFVYSQICMNVEKSRSLQSHISYHFAFNMQSSSKAYSVICYHKRAHWLKELWAERRLSELSSVWDKVLRESAWVQGCIEDFLPRGVLQTPHC